MSRRESWRSVPPYDVMPTAGLEPAKGPGLSQAAVPIREMGAKLMQGIEPRLRPYQGRVLPLYYTSMVHTHRGGGSYSACVARQHAPVAAGYCTPLLLQR